MPTKLDEHYVTLIGPKDKRITHAGPNLENTRAKAYAEAAKRWPGVIPREHQGRCSAPRKQP